MLTHHCKGQLTIPQQLTALWANVFSLLMEPEQLLWKAYFHYWLHRSRE